MISKMLKVHPMRKIAWPCYRNYLSVVLKPLANAAMHAESAFEPSICTISRARAKMNSAYQQKFFINTGHDNLCTLASSLVIHFEYFNCIYVHITIELNVLAN